MSAPNEVDSGPSATAEETGSETTPVPLLWMSDGIPLWLLLLLAIPLLLALFTVGWRKRRRNQVASADAADA